MAERSEKQKMLAGALYNANGPELTGERRAAQRLLARYNVTECRMMPRVGWRCCANCSARWATTRTSSRAFIAITATTSGSGGIAVSSIATACFSIARRSRSATTCRWRRPVQLYAAYHPLDRAYRVAGLESAKPIRIGHGVWIGGGAIVLPGVTIGDGAVIGAGSVVTHDVSADSLAVGNPARIVRSLV